MKLLPCPFCGGEPRTAAGMEHCACDCMGIPIPWMLITDWNRRPKPAKSPATSTTKKTGSK